MAAPVPVETGTVVPTLQSCEAIIQAGLATFIDVGEALAEIQTHKLYRSQGFKTFDEYCRERWQFDRTYASRLVGAAEVSKVLPMGNKPANERQARALAPLKNEPEKLAEAMATATEKSDGKPTTAAIEDAVRQMQHRAPTNPEAEAQLGTFARSCRDLSRLPAVSAFLDAQDLKDRHRKYAEDAYAWLGDLLNEWNTR